MFSRALFLTLACFLGVGCASTPDPSSVEQVETAQPHLNVRPASRKSPNLLAIKDPITLAVEARAAGDFNQAYRHFYAAWIATPENEDVSASFADMALRVGNLPQAYDAVSRFNLDTETAKPNVIAAQVLSEIAVGKSPDAEGRLRTALERSPKDARLWNALGRHYDSHGQHSQAQSSYQTAVESGGSTAGIMNNFGMSLLMQGQHAAALSKFSQAAKIDSADDLYDNNRRLTLALMGDYDGATTGMDGPRASDILNDAGYIAKTRNDFAMASALFKASINQSEAHHPKAHGNLQALKQLRILHQLNSKNSNQEISSVLKFD